MHLKGAQIPAVEEGGVQLILAGPGSGKTLVITEKILHLLANGVQPNNILALTFSRKAAQEMVERLEKSIDPSDLTIGTFHSFCFSVLEDNILESGISFDSGHIDRTNQLVWALRNIDSFVFERLRVGNNAARLVESIIDGISAFKDELITPKDLALYLERKETQQVSEEERDYLHKLCDLLKVYEAYEPYKRQAQLLDFDDQIGEALRLFSENPLLVKRYRQRYTHILVDEFQDTNYAQLCLIKQLAGENICVVGDDDQAIYRFRGAYLTNFKDFSDHFSPKELLLDVNYRNSRNILTLAMQLMQNAPYRKEKALTTENPDGALITVARCENEQAEAAYVLNEIQKSIENIQTRTSGGEQRPVSYKDIAVLSRQRASGVKIHEILQKNGIPAEFVGEVDFFAAPVIRDVIAYLRILNDPLVAGVSFARVMKSLGISEANISLINSHAKQERQADVTDGVFYAILEASEFLRTQNVEVKEIAHLINELLDRKERISLTKLVYEILVNYSGLYKNNIDGDNRRNVSLLNRFYELVQDYGSSTKEASVQDLLEFLDLLTGFELEMEDYEETDSVKIMTVHQSKGKEFPVVFVIDLAANKFPSRHRSKPFYVPSDLSRGLKIEADERSLYEQEERRLLYVAMTRAKQKLYLTYAEHYGENKSISKASPFLFEINYENNPLIDPVYVQQEEAAHVLSEESPVEKTKRHLQEQAAQAVYQMRTKTALQHLIDLEKVRLIESGGAMDDFSLEEFTRGYGRDHSWLESLLRAEPAPLISENHRFSASALNTYENCPQHYKFAYVLNVPSASQISFNLGSLIHDIIYQLTLRELEGVPPSELQAFELLERLWPSAGFASKQEEEERREEAQQLLATYVEWNLEDENEVIGAEVEFLFPLKGRNVKGFIDRLERTPEGHYVVVDFKTGSSMESKNTIKDNIQMNVYCLAVQNKFGQLPERASLLYLKKGKTVDYTPDPENVEMQQAKLAEIVEQVLNESFDAQPSHAACLFCGYHELCGEMEVKD
jgi:DNA helicase-2/ATP-dependent DNA helicase PcrA